MKWAFVNSCLEMYSIATGNVNFLKCNCISTVKHKEQLPRHITYKVDDSLLKVTPLYPSTVCFVKPLGLHVFIDFESSYIDDKILYIVYLPFDEIPSFKYLFMIFSSKSHIIRFHLKVVLNYRWIYNKVSFNPFSWKCILDI